MNIKNSLSRVDLFNGLSSGQLDDVARIVSLRKYNNGDIVFLDGDAAVGFYMVAGGRVKVYKVSPDGKEQIMHIFGTGQPFAEVPVFAGSHYPANAEAMESSTLFFFPKKEFIRLIHENPSLAMNMLASLSQRLKHFSNLVEALSLKEVPGRLASYLLYLSDRNGSIDEFGLDITKAQLASFLGTIPETLSRIFAKMGSRELARIDGPHIVILDREGLEDLAEGESKL
ncbi:MAG: Crp/Fnr family transcriptional regulator [Deltaproteobacteria bacterium]|jgi:CRP/FNR family transcriptional regulator|nr:Crp/Fnr family transcriptional regulator [Deltaproteobacteria bacterium]